MEKIHDINTALETLQDEGWVAADQEYSIEFVVTMLYQLTITAPTAQARILKCGAILLNQIKCSEQAQIVANTIKAELEEPITEFQEMRENMRAWRTSVEEQIELLGQTTNELKTELFDTQHESREILIDIQTATKTMIEQTKENQTAADVKTEMAAAHHKNQEILIEIQRATKIMIEHAEKTVEAPAITQQSKDASPAATDPTSYAAKLHLPPIHAQVMRRAEEKSRQVMFTTAKGVESQGLSDQTPDVIMEKARVALKAMGALGPATPEDVEFMGVKVLTKGDIVFDLNSSHAADWLRKDTNKTNFIRGFGAMSAIKDRELSVVVENVPISFYVSADSFLKIEKVNKLEPGTIVLGRWIKPPERRTTGQRTAFMILHFRDPQSANRAIREGIYAENRKCTVRKLLPEPRRCFRCLASRPS